MSRLTKRYSTSPLGTRWENALARPIMVWTSGCVIRLLRQLVRKPMFSEMDMPLSLRTTTNLSGLRWTMLFTASKLEPEVIAPSPTTAMVHESSWR